MSSSTSSTSMMDYFRPKGKIVCIGDDLNTELELINTILEADDTKRLPVLLLSLTNQSSEHVDQAVTFNPDITLPLIHNLLNSHFLFFVFNSSEQGILRILGTILASIEYRGSIPIFIDTGTGGLSRDKKNFLGECYFHFDLSNNRTSKQFQIFLEGMISALASNSGVGISFSNLLQIFGKSSCLFYGISFSNSLDEVLDSLVDQIGESLVKALPETLEQLDVIFISVISKNSLNLQTMNKITQKFTNTFGREIEINFSNSCDKKLEGYEAFAILTDNHSVQEVIPIIPPIPNSIFDDAADSSTELNLSTHQQDNLSDDDEEDMRFKILGKIFSETEVYIFDDGGLPLFASHRPAGQEVCLYTGLFSAIQSMSSDLIGHSPDYLTAGDKRCMFISQEGPDKMQLRGVAICTEGLEEKARNDLKISMDLVQSFIGQGEPEYVINDKLQNILVTSYQNGELGNI
ncbi:MAG: hypothetical protein ACTSR4_04805, partial [Candidatus Hodarchaeales archaeon]